MSACISIVGYVAVGGLQAGSIVVKATVDAAIQVAIALWERNSSLSIANMQEELAKRQTVLAEEIHAHAKIFWPEETELVADIFGEGKAVTLYHPLANGWGQMADVASNNGRSNWIAQMTARCTPASQCEDARWQRNAQLVRTDVLSYASRQDENRTQILNDRRYARQYAVLGLAKGQLADLLGYQGISQSIGINASEMLVSSVNSGLAAFGYYGNRMDVQPWGAGTREQLAQYSKTAPMPTTQQGSPRLTGPVAQPALTQLNPVSSELLKAPAVQPVKQPSYDSPNAFKKSYNGGRDY